MRLLLDTNIISYILRDRSQVLSRMEEALSANATFLSCEVVDYELRRYLILKGATRQLRRYEALSQDWFQVHLTRGDWHEAAKLWAGLHAQGLSIEDRDLLIGVAVRKEKATLVTANTRHFGHLDVSLVDWTSPPAQGR